MCEQLARVLVKDELFWEPVANTHHESTFCLSYINHRVQAAERQNRRIKLANCIYSWGHCTFAHSHRGCRPWVSEPLPWGHPLQLQRQLLHRHCTHIDALSLRTHWIRQKNPKLKIRNHIRTSYQNFADRSMLLSKHFWIKSGHFRSEFWSRIGWIRWFNSWQAWIVPYQYTYVYTLNDIIIM